MTTPPSGRRSPLPCGWSGTSRSPGEASGGEDACIGAKELQPDVVLMDLSMPDISGIEAMQRIHSSTPELPVVILTAHADEGVERAARGAGASGFVAKGRGCRTSSGRCTR